MPLHTCLQTLRVQPCCRAAADWVSGCSVCPLLLEVLLNNVVVLRCPQVMGMRCCVRLYALCSMGTGPWAAGLASASSDLCCWRVERPSHLQSARHALSCTIEACAHLFIDSRSGGRGTDLAGYSALPARQAMHAAALARHPINSFAVHALVMMVCAAINLHHLHLHGHIWLIRMHSSPGLHQPGSLTQWQPAAHRWNPATTAAGSNLVGQDLCSFTLSAAMPACYALHGKLSRCRCLCTYCI